MQKIETNFGFLTENSSISPKATGSAANATGISIETGRQVSMGKGRDIFGAASELTFSVPTAMIPMNPSSNP
jgi:hypothetical protein